MFIMTFWLSAFSCVSDFWASNYDFTTHAVYFAPTLHAKAFVLTKGFVPKGEDLGDINAAIIQTKIVFDNKPTDTIFIATNGLKVSQAQVSGQVLLIADSTDYAATMANCARHILITKSVSTEFKELADAILSTATGPKGTYFKGQAKSIIVDTVFIRTNDR